LARNIKKYGCASCLWGCAVNMESESEESDDEER
jgi:hypothetical protein